ncbi:hypothetical protein Tco_0601772 [Tanacetum coccineum]
MVLPDNQIGSPNSVLDEKMFENSSNDSDFNVELIPPSLIRGIKEDKIWDKIGNPLRPNHIERGYSIYCENTINMINSIKDLREENRDMFSSINVAIKLILSVATNMSYVVENDIKKEGLKDNLKEYNTLKGIRYGYNSK